MNGVLLIDKASGPTSHDVVAQARRALGIRSIGHAGTLDPLASGLLVLLVGEATKISDYLLNGDKGYEVTVRLGIRTDSMDRTGVVLETRAIPETMSREAVESVVASLTGTLSLHVPAHSAVKVDGKKLYELAHRGAAPEETPLREMTFLSTKVLGMDRVGDGVDVRVEIRCSKGSYIRAWANELGRVLGVGGTVQELRRIESAPFFVKDGISIETLKELWEGRDQRSGAVLGSAWVDLQEALPHFGRIEIEGQDAVLMRNGQISKGVQAELLRTMKLGEAPKPVRIIHRAEGRLLALLVAEPGEFYKIRRVFT